MGPMNETCLLKITELSIQPSTHPSKVHINPPRSVRDWWTTLPKDSPILLRLSTGRRNIVVTTQLICESDNHHHLTWAATENKWRRGDLWVSAESDKKLDGVINMFLSGRYAWDGEWRGGIQRIRIWQNNYTLSFIVHHNPQRDFSAALFIGAGWAALQQSASPESSKVYAARAVLSLGYSAFNGTSFVCGNSRYMTYLQEEEEEEEFVY